MNHLAGGHIISVDVERLKRIMRSDGRPRKTLERDAGLSKCSTLQIEQRGRCTDLTLDALCGALGIHESEVMP